MISSRQYVAVKFRIADSRTHTYVWDGEPLAEGDQVKVADARSDGWKRVYVVSISDEAPPFECKPILGKVDPEPADALATTRPDAGINPEDLF
ncbi:hypothetical protein [Sphingomonas sp.]|uniref:hypothetical protein n=1 Tax=Sphingomonas sp. TaxID=28214 RepID=UPI0035C84A0B